LRFTLAAAAGLGDSTGIGIGWHHYLGEGAVRGLDAFDLGMSTRIGSVLALGAGVRDISTGAVAGTDVQRRYQIEAVVRPFERDTLALAAGGRIGEAHGDLDGWGRVSLRAGRGVYVVGSIESRALRAVDVSPMGSVERTLRDARISLGVELSFGALGVIAVGSGIRDSQGERRLFGGGLVATLSSVPPPSVIPPADHIERVELAGSIGVRQLTAVVLRLRAIARDPSAKAVVILFDGVRAGWAALQELRNELAAIRDNGKTVFAYMVSGTGRDYYVASAANKIYVDPAGGIRLVGIAGHRFYFRGAFDQVGVSPQFEKIGEYKSAPEQFTNSAPTPAAARMHDELFDSLWSQWRNGVASGRGLAEHEVAALVEQGPYTSGDLAKVGKLVDAIATPDQVTRLIAADLRGHYSVGVPSPARPERWRRPAVAVVYVDGDITDGQSKTIPLIQQSLAGGETIAAALTAARNDPSVGAIVLRIDSPGGSAVASELVAREVFATRGVKPIICSLSNVAASGGYYIAAGCDAIFAEPMTITGSIGIFFGKFDLSGLLAKLGVVVTTLKRGQRADIDSPYRPYTDAERAALVDKLRYMYDRFVGAVARGRKLTAAAVDAAGQGRVFTGEQAQPRSLIDKFGGIGDALDEAKRRIGLQPTSSIEVRELPKLAGSVLGVVGKLIGVRDEMTIGLVELPALRELVRGIGASLLVAPEIPQARLPYDLEFSD
jgi:protease-4